MLLPLPLLCMNYVNTIAHFPSNSGYTEISILPQEREKKPYQESDIGFILWSFIHSSFHGCHPKPNKRNDGVHKSHTHSHVHNTQGYFYREGPAYTLFVRLFVRSFIRPRTSPHLHWSMWQITWKYARLSVCVPPKFWGSISTVWVCSNETMMIGGGGWIMSG